ncbi:NADH:ubiquinone oxidoreductase subunit NDUFA12 [Pseudopelagicola sp. nBUS_20]|uniref:NADH:ubiquinone oxidoreductase subunit NDUFA12 n=1 Tax=Pseudopelagicola sp. nBUS_20 TaxID=3395317 RepID=UPI003EB77190
MSVLSTISSFLTWWNGGTLNTRLYTRRKGVKMGEDDQGNIYYRNSDDTKRWVMFNGEVEASRIGADWHGWLHKTFDECPTDKPLKRREWEKPHQKNLSGTAMAYAPAGSIRAGVPINRSDYEAWSPE